MVNPQITNSVLVQSIEDGGLNLVDLDNKIKVTKSSW